ncbi:MAG: hypothetical protein GX275_09420 [Clostridiales bacterium]|nr:hypothetical protein [Clostridiales bacterium]
MKNKENDYLISDNDKEVLNLLYTQHAADIIVIIADILSYISTIESINLVYSKYNLSNIIHNPDIPAVNSSILLFFARSIYTKISIIRYNNLIIQKENGEFNYSLEPDSQIIFSNILDLLSYYYRIIGSIGIYNRDINQPVFGF